MNMCSVKISIPNNFSGGMPSIDDNSKFTPAVIEYDYWINSQMSIAKYYGELKVNGVLYKLIDSGEPAPQGLYKPDLVREDWCMLYKKLHRGVKEYIKQGLTPKQVRKILKSKK